MKIDDKKQVNRLLIYFFYDKQGIVDRFVPYMLDDITKHTTEVCIVCNGQLNSEGKKVLENYGKVLVRENKGFDVWAYKSALESYGWERLQKFDEVIMMNSTIMGPLYPFQETFDKMNEKDLDFWGLTLYKGVSYDPFGCISYGYIPDHIQSHWIACRKSLVSSKDFQKYWDNMPMIHKYEEAVGMHEAIFTKTFADKGFKYAVSVEAGELAEYSEYPLMMCAPKLIEEKRCPIFKRRNFFHHREGFLRSTAGEQTVELYNYLKDKTDYDVDFIWETVLRNYHQADVVSAMNLTYVLPTNQCEYAESECILDQQKVVLVMHLYFTDLLGDSLHYAQAMPEQADIYITTDSEKKKKKIEEVFSVLPNRTEIRVIENRGRDVSSLLVGVKDVIENYDLVCFVHDKKTTQVDPGTVGASFSYKCFENNLANENFVRNVLKTFQDNPRLGLLTPPEPNHSIFFQTISKEWGPNFDVTKKLAEELGLKVPMSYMKKPIAPLGTMFWFRREAMMPLYKKNWEYSDFPEEPNKTDGTILHAIERIYPFVVQEQGYYPAICMSDNFAAIEYQNLRFFVESYSNVVLKEVHDPYIDAICNHLNAYIDEQSRSTAYLKWQVKKGLKRVLPEKVYKAGGKVRRKIKQKRS